MHRSSLFLATSLFAIALPSVAFASFPDVPSSRKDAVAIQHLQSKGVVVGYTDGTFRPDQPINRAEFLKMLIESNRDVLAGVSIYNWHGSEPAWTDSSCSALSSPFLREENDIEFGQWYSGYVCYGLYQGIVIGYPDHTFRPFANINFAEGAKIASLVFNTGDAEPIQEIPGGTWFAPYLHYLGYHNAIPANVVSYDMFLTRGQMATIVYNLDINRDRTPKEGTYHNVRYGFSLTLPAGTTLSDNGLQQTYELPILISGTNLGEKFLRIRETKSDASCSDADLHAKSGQNITIGGVPYIKEQGSDGGAGQRYNDTSYAMSIGNACISFAFTLHSSDPQTSDPPVPEFNVAKESAVFEQILATIEWDGESPF